MYVEDCLTQSYFKDFHQKKKVRRITLIDKLLRWKQSRICVEGKVAHKGHGRNAWCAHGGTPWRENNKKVVGENSLLAQNEGKHRTLHLHLCQVPKYQIGTQKEIWGCIGPFNPLWFIQACFNEYYGMFSKMGRDGCHLCGGKHVFKTS